MSETTESSAPDLSSGGDWEESKPVEAVSDWDDEPAVEEEKPAAKAPAPKAKAEPPKASEPKLEPLKPSLKKVKIDGREELVDEDELIRSYSKSKAAEAKFREAAELDKQIKAFTEAFEKDPLSVLKNKNLPIDRKALGERLLLESLEEEMMDPRDRKLKEYEAKLSEAEKAQKQIEEQRKAYEFEQKKELKRQEISGVIQKALEMTPLSKEPETAGLAMRDMAMMMRIAADRGLQVSPEEMAAQVNLKYQKSMYSLANTLEGEDLIGFLGEEVVKKIRKADLARLKANTQQTQTHKDENWDPESQARSSKERRTMTPYEAREQARKMLFGK